MADMPMLVVAAALTDATGRVLVQQRPPGKSHAGQWEFPGGKVEAGESPEAALSRELAEELAIDVDPDRCVPVAFSTVSRATGRIVLLLYRIRGWSGEPRAVEAAAMCWGFPAELATLSMPDADRPLVAALAAAWGRS